MPDRVRSMRRELVERLNKRIPNDFGSSAAARHLLVLGPVARADGPPWRERYSVYGIESGRICVPPLNPRNLDYAAEQTPRPSPFTRPSSPTPRPGLSPGAARPAYHAPVHRGALGMATKLKPVDVVTVGVGLTGTILAKELADLGLKVVGLERGGPRDTHPDFDMPHAHDELRYARRHELMQDLSRETLTFRNAIGEPALPMRQMGSFLPGEGVGARRALERRHLRFLPGTSRLAAARSRATAEQLAEDCTSQDWGVTDP